MSFRSRNYDLSRGYARKHCRYCKDETVDPTTITCGSDACMRRFQVDIDQAREQKARLATSPADPLPPDRSCSFCPSDRMRGARTCGEDSCVAKLLREIEAEA